MEVTKAEFARQAGVNRAAISQKIEKKTLVVNTAGMLDTENPVNAAYLSKHRQRAADIRAAEQIRNGGGKSFTGETFSGGSQPSEALKYVNNTLNDFALMEVAGVPARELLNMTLREIVMKYPGIDKIERYAKILKDATMSAEREQRILERALTLIPKDFVVSRLFAFIEGITKQLLEYPEAAVDRVIALANTESETMRVEIVETLTRGLSQIINGTKENVVSELNSLKNKYQKDIQTYDSQLDDIKQVLKEATGNG